MVINCCVIKWKWNVESLWLKEVRWLNLINLLWGIGYVKCCVRRWLVGLLRYCLRNSGFCFVIWYL